MVCAYTVYTFCLICAIFSHCTLVHEATPAQETRQAGQKGWTMGVNAIGTWKRWRKGVTTSESETRASWLCCQRGAECSVYKVINLWEPKPERPARLNQIMWATAREELLKLHTKPPVIALRKKAEHTDYTDTIPHSCMCSANTHYIIRHTLKETVPKCEKKLIGVTGNKWNVHTKLLNPHPWLATLQATSNCLESLLPTAVVRYYSTVMTQSMYNEPKHIATQMSTFITKLHCSMNTSIHLIP